jgi:catechol 2,3-dioxygenase-like lactoylglutathione lyase family enzyme
MSGVQRNLHFGFTVSNLDRSVAFFQQCLGLQIETSGQDRPEVTEHFVGVPGADLRYCVLKGHDHTIELMEYYGPPARRVLQSRSCDVGFAHLCYQVADAEAFIARAAQFDMRPVNPILTFSTRACRGIYMRDPDGLTIEIIQPT